MPDGHSYFLITRRTVAQSPSFSLAEYRPGAGFVNEQLIPDSPGSFSGQRPLLDNGRLILAETGGAVAAFDDAGNLLWAKDHGITFRGISAAPGGFIACGQTPGGQATLIRLDANGDEIWRKETPDKDYFSAVPAAAGGFAATGQSAADTIVLVRFDAAGELLWQNKFGPGTGLRVRQDPGGGFVLAAQGVNPSGLRLAGGRVQPGVMAGRAVFGK